MKVNLSKEQLQEAILQSAIQMIREGRLNEDAYSLPAGQNPPAGNLGQQCQYLVNQLNQRIYSMELQLKPLKNAFAKRQQGMRKQPQQNVQQNAQQNAQQPQRQAYQQRVPQLNVPQSQPAGQISPEMDRRIQQQLSARKGVNRGGMPENKNLNNRRG